MSDSESNPNPPRDAAHAAQILERRLRGFRRRITGLPAVDTTLISANEADVFEARLNDAKDAWKEFLSCWEKREELSVDLGASDSFPSNSWCQYYDTLKEEVIKASGALISIRKRDSRTKPIDVKPVDDSSTMGSHMFTGKPQLPRIPIPTFCGDLLKWTHFRDTFRSMIHEEPSLTNVERFHYLIGALKGEAAALIAKFPVEDASYAPAWAKVNETYDNPRMLASVIIQRLIDYEVKPARTELQRYEAFLTNVADSVEAFRALELADPGGFLLTTLALRALDVNTRRQYELSLKSCREFPTVDSVIDFVRQRRMALKISQDFGTGSGHDTPRRNANRGGNTPPRLASVALHASSTSSRKPCIDRRSSPATTPVPARLGNQRTQGANATPGVPRKCPHCQGDHLLSQCSAFKDVALSRRIEIVHSQRVCWNCLRQGHGVSSCPSKFRCQTCHGKHHTLVHKDEVKPPEPKEPVSGPEALSLFGSASIKTPPTATTVLLGTVSTFVRSSNGTCVLARGLLDSGSQHSFITSSLASRIGAKTAPFATGIVGLADQAVPRSHLKGLTHCSLRPRHGHQDFKFTPVVVDMITSNLPSSNLQPSVVKKLMSHQLADPQFGDSSPIDILIGGDLYPLIITGTPRRAGVDKLFLSPTAFGLVVSGTLLDKPSASSMAFLSKEESIVDSRLKAFWEIEEPAPVDRSHPDDLLCEEHFVRTHSRTPDGRYVVRLPFKHEPPELGDNRDIVHRRFYSLESKFKKDPKLALEYIAFLKEYEELGHMSPTHAPSQYVIPHHGVIQQRPGGSKLRVVFDASCPSTSHSLNDLLLAGPNLQEDLSTVLMRFRFHVIAICADMVKMYRQILIHPQDRRFQHILWRDDVSKAIREMELNTVTYGIKSSSYQALRVIRQLVTDEGADYPLASSRIQTDRYVDDFVSGAQSEEEAKGVIKELCALLAKGGFALSKWASNAPQILPSSQERVVSVTIQPPDQGHVKILGMFWNSCTDCFSFTVTQPPTDGVTKREMLSSVARIFDPMGLLTPVTLAAKVLIQEVWRAKLSWDQVLPPEIGDLWNDLVTEWDELASISIPRCVSSGEADSTLIGFCDASTKAYAAAVYIRSEDTSGQVKVSLLKAKSKVAPISFLSVPRLELCGALLLSRLLASIPSSMGQCRICFCDSETVLSWLAKPPHDLPVFEANRVSQVVNTIHHSLWLHVKSEDNPADIASRGCTPVVLRRDKLWWSGPAWLRLPIQEWFRPRDVALTALALPCQRKEQSFDWTERFSSFRTLVRTTARILRYIRRIRSRIRQSTPEELSVSGPICATEFSDAEIRCIRFVQQTYFPKELLEGSYCPSFAQLSPFIDERGIVRVGGRLHEATIEFSVRHPILIPRESHVAGLLVDHLHASNFHSGPSMTLALLRQRYWIPRAGKFIRGLIQRCVRCRLRKANPVVPVMASLPKERFSESRAFNHVGVDYAGPFMIKESRRRNASIGKAYLCLFVCMSSKALHLEVVSSLTTTAFLAALERFISRRGRPSSIWSDHGTNFVGASRYIRDVLKFHRDIQDVVAENLAPSKIEWKFIPPRAPHFGGLWEAGVKSVKGLLVNSVGKQPYSFEELTTVVAKIEAILNSRPLCRLTDDVDNFDFLTPGHFLIGAPLTALPVSDERASSSNFMSRWESMRQHIAHIWNRWRREYLHTLQQRVKWTMTTPQLKVGDLVILIERRPLVGHWPVARVAEVFPGRDNVVRAVAVKTPSGNTFTRAVSSLVPLFHPQSPVEV